MLKSSDKTNRLFLIPVLLFMCLEAFNQPPETTYPGTEVKKGYDNDVSYGPFNLNFNFTFFGNDYSQFYVSSNGLVLFGNGSISPAEVSIPDTTLPNNFIAPFWDDLAIDPSGKILYTTVGSVGNRKCIIQFKNMDFWNPLAYMGTFFVILYETSNNIQIQYRLIVDKISTRPHGESATIGIENSDGSAGVEYAYHLTDAIAAEQAILFTPSGATYSINDNAIYDGVYLTTNISLPEPGITPLTNPPENAIIGSDFKFEWLSSTNAASYSLKISQNSDLSGGTSYNAGANLSFNVTGLTLDAIYYWAVFATNATGTTWCEINRFFTSSDPPLAAVPQTVWTEQGLDKTIKLLYTGGGASSKFAIITSQPSQGQLYQYNSGVRGSQITTVPIAVTDASMNIIYAASGTAGNNVGNFNYKVIDALGDSPEGTITVNVSPPGVPNVLHVAKNENVEIQFDKTMSDPAGKADQFEVTVNGTSATINSATLKEGDNKTIILNLLSPLYGTETVYVSYTQGDITAATGGYLFSFTDQPVTLRAQTIDFSQSLAKKYNESPFAITATTTSGLPLTYNSSNITVATFTGNILSFLSMGTSNITLRQLGNPTYAPAIYVKTLTISKGDQIITFNALPSKTISDADFSPGAISSSGLQVTFTSSNTAVATILSGLIHIVGAGTSEITASQTGNSLYNPATPVIQTLTVSNPVLKTLSLTSVLLQALYQGGGLMRQANDDFGPHWPAGVADHITVELHSSSDYATIVYIDSNVSLSISGTATISIPYEYNSSYYITVKHRNSIETTSDSPVSFAGSNISQSFGSPSNVFYGNLGVSFDTYYFIYGGDVDQDGFVGASDMAMVDNQSAAFGMGYIVEDVDGDGFVGASDMAIIDNNSANFIFAITPF